MSAPGGCGPGGEGGRVVRAGCGVRSAHASGYDAAPRAGRGSANLGRSLPPRQDDEADKEWAKEMLYF